VVGIGNQVEPIPGYRLLERLGQGGFGEVWKAEAPGGLFKTVKIVYGCLGSTDDDHNLVHQELKALERVKAVRHPYILSLDRYDIVDGRLIIVTELADCCLWDRFRECRTQGCPGIPRDELLRYLEEAAEALDLMNSAHQLQHLDIKAQNLFLLYNHIKVGDFGLVKDLAGVRAQATSGFTVTYASPETFQGQISRFSDQYNLAIVYQELLTGQLPLSGTNPQQLMLQHVTGVPNLAPLPPGDRPAIGRALAKKPEDRHPSCGDLVRALRQSGGEEAEAVAINESPIWDSGSSHDTPPRKNAATLLPSVEILPTLPQRPEVLGDGVLFPALVVGLGGLGLGVLRQLRKTLCQRHGPAAAWPHLRLLHLDTDPEGTREATEGTPDTVLKESEVLLARLQRPSHYLKAGRECETLQSWLPMGMLSRLPRDQATPVGWRPLGRLAFVTNQPAIAGRLRADLEACMAPEALALAEQQTGLGLRTNQPRVYVVTSLAGGTGGGMFLDLAYEVRYQLRVLGYASAEVVGLFLLTAAGGGGAPLAAANAFAALTELNYFTTNYRARGGRVAALGQPFSRCFVLPLPEETAGTAPLAELAALAGDFLCRDLTTPLGRAADRYRTTVPVSDTGMAYQTFGAFWFAVPRRPLLQRVARRLGHRLVETWRMRDHVDEAIRDWVAMQLLGDRLSPERLTERRGLRSDPASGTSRALRYDHRPADPGGGSQTESRSGRGSHGPYGNRAARGSPWGVRAGYPGRGPEPGRPQVASRAQRQLAELALRALSAPQFRLTGADQAVRGRLLDALGEEAQNQKALGEQRAQEAADLHEQATWWQTKLSQRSRWWGSRTKAAAELLKALRLYARATCQALTFRQVGDLYEGLLAELPKYLRDVQCCHPRIAQFLQRFADTAVRSQPEVDLGLGQYLLPGSCRTLAEAAAHLVAGLAPEELLDLSQNVQTLVGRNLKEQVHLCTAAASFFRDLEEEIYRQVATFAEAQLSKAHAAEVYLEQHPNDEAMPPELSNAFAEASPKLTHSDLPQSSELCILAVPPGAEGTYFHDMAARALPDRKLVTAASTNDIVFYREQLGVPASALPPLGPAGREAYHQLLAGDQLTPHSRIDIVDWSPARRS
jgi:hypothetical protein